MSDSHSVVSNIWDHMGCSLPDYSVHRVLQTGILEWVVIVLLLCISRTTGDIEHIFMCVCVCVCVCVLTSSMSSSEKCLSSVQFNHSVVSDSLRPHESQHARPPCPSPTLWVYSNSYPSSWWCHPAISPSVVPFSSCPPIPPSIRIFPNESTLPMRWPKYWCFSFSISPSNEHPGLISFRMDWFDLLSVQQTLNSLLQHHSSKASIFRPSAFFTVQLSHPNMTTGETIALTRLTFVGKVMSLLFNMLSRLVRNFLPRSKCLLISWLQ